jgi:hypothetical protein
MLISNIDLTTAPLNAKLSTVGSPNSNNILSFQERNEVERIWQKKLLEAQARYDKECDELTKHFQENVTQLRDRYEREQKERELAFSEKLHVAVEEAKKVGGFMRKLDAFQGFPKGYWWRF